MAWQLQSRINDFAFVCQSLIYVSISPDVNDWDVFELHDKNIG